MEKEKELIISSENGRVKFTISGDVETTCWSYSPEEAKTFTTAINQIADMLLRSRSALKD